jgi:hypothetical protein
MMRQGLTRATQTGRVLQRKAAEPAQGEGVRTNVRGTPGPRPAGQQAEAPSVPEPKFGHDFSRVRTTTPSKGGNYRREIPLVLPLDVEEGQMTPHLGKIVSDLGPGQPLPSAAKERFQRSSPVPLDSVRVHADPKSAQTAGFLNSEAFAVGNHVVLGPSPRSQARSDWLLAHEVAHTIQQHPLMTGGANGNQEAEADRFADLATSPVAREGAHPPVTTAAPVGLARKVIWKFTQDLPGGLLLILDVDDGDFVGGCVRSIVPHVGVKLIQKVPHLQLFNLHVGFVTNPAGQTCIFFYESVSGICQMKCFKTMEELKESWEEIKEWLVEMLKKLLEALAIAVLVVALVVLAYLIAEAILAALLVLA